MNSKPFSKDDFDPTSYDLASGPEKPRTFRQSSLHYPGDLRSTAGAAADAMPFFKAAVEAREERPKAPCRICNKVFKLDGDGDVPGHFTRNAVGKMRLCIGGRMPPRETP